LVVSGNFFISRLKNFSDFKVVRKDTNAVQHMCTFITDERSASKYFDNFKAYTGMSYPPHDFFESNPLMSVRISSGMVGEKNVCK